jgi:hypothetical protein
MWTIPVDASQGEISFDVINFQDDAAAIVAVKDENLKNIMMHIKMKKNLNKNAEINQNKVMKDIKKM